MNVIVQELHFELRNSNPRHPYFSHVHFTKRGSHNAGWCLENTRNEFLFRLCEMADIRRERNQSIANRQQFAR